jgi:hypothetical protein
VKQEKVNAQDGYDVGIGVAMATGSPMALGAVGEITPPVLGGGGSGSFTFRRIDSNEALATELGISADVSGGIGLFSASASLDFTNKCQVQASSLVVLISAEERFAFQQMDSPALSPAAAKLVEDGRTDLFAERFGDYFIRGVGTGGRFFGAIRIETKSSSSKTQVDAALSGNYGMTISAEARLHISKVLTTSNARVDAFITFEGGRVSTHPRTGDPLQVVQDLYTAMDEWSATVRDQPKAYRFTLAPYVIALGPNPPNAAELEHQRDVLIRCAKLRTATMDKLNLVDYIQNPLHRDEFAVVAPPAGPDLPALQAALARDLDVISDAASFAIDNPQEARAPEAFMREINGVADFALTALPANMPAHVGPPALPATPPKRQVQVPDLVGSKSLRIPQVGHAILLQRGLQFKDSGPLEIRDGERVLKGHVVSQEPAAGMTVDEGTVVLLGIGDYQPPKKFLKLGPS